MFPRNNHSESSGHPPQVLGGEEEIPAASLGSNRNKYARITSKVLNVPGMQVGILAEYLRKEWRGFAGIKFRNKEAQKRLKNPQDLLRECLHEMLVMGPCSGVPGKHMRS